MRVIRSSVFETNSSSSHTFIYNSTYLYDLKNFNDDIQKEFYRNIKDNKIIIIGKGSRYGRNFNILSGEYEKIRVLLADMIDKDLEYFEVVEEYINYKFNSKIVLEYLTVINNELEIDVNSRGFVFNLIFGDIRKAELNDKIDTIYCRLDEYLFNQDLKIIINSDDNLQIMDYYEIEKYEKYREKGFIIIDEEESSSIKGNTIDGKYIYIYRGYIDNPYDELDFVYNISKNLIEFKDYFHKTFR